jgi:hypothetical protein
MVLTAYFVLSPVTGLSCHRRHANYFAKLDTSVGAPGPHDFAVRTLRPPHPAPNVRDDRETPLYRDGMAWGSKGVSTRRRSEIFLQAGLDRQMTDLPVGQIVTGSRCLIVVKRVAGRNGTIRSDRRVLCDRHIEPEKIVGLFGARQSSSHEVLERFGRPSAQRAIAGSAIHP